MSAGLYVHVPFCSAICPYCDFAVKVARPGEAEAYLAALEREAAHHAGAVHDWHFDTVYLGGGTPSLVDPAKLARLLAALRRRLPVADDAALFLEANPEDVDRDRLAAWRDLGVRFLSLGVQSFDDATLRFLGRRHDAAAARRAVEAALAAGFATVSVDLIYGLADQTAAAWRRALDLVAGLGPPHLSCYELEIHERTPFGRRQARGEAMTPGEEVERRLFALTHEYLAAHGYEGYEVSNFARAPGHRSRHNRKYWDGSPYLGLGPGAHSFDGVRRRWWNARHLRAWLRAVGAGGHGIAGEETLADGDLALEMVMLGLRTRAGVDLAAYRRRFGGDLAAANAVRLAGWRDAGLVVTDGDRLAPTVAGMAVADALAGELALPLGES